MTAATYVLTVANGPQSYAQHGLERGLHVLHSGLACRKLRQFLTLALTAICSEDRQRDLTIGDVVVDSFGGQIIARTIDFHRFNG